MKHTKEETKKIKTTYHTCDICNKKASTYKCIKIHTCHGCGCDVCDECGSRWFYDPWWGDDNGDYPPVVCNTCNELMKPLSEVAKKITNQYNDDISELITQWEEACINAT